MNPVIRLQSVTKQYGAQKALDHVSLDVQPGTVCALLGENGAGKTTAIRILLGLTEPDEGHATVLGLDSALQGQQIRSRVGYVPERPTLYEWMTVTEIGWFTAGFYPSGFYERYLKLAAGYQLPLKAQNQIAIKRHAGQSFAVVGHGSRAGTFDPGRADVRIRYARAAGIPRGNGRHRRGRPHGAALQPSNRRSGTRGRHRGDFTLGPIDLGGKARNLKRPDA